MAYRCVTDIQEIRRYLSDAGVYAFDIETAPYPMYAHEERAALDPHKGFICGISFSVCPGDAIYVPIRHTAGCNANEHDVARLMRTIMQGNDRKIAHNLAFESSFFYGQWGIVIQPPVYDTILASLLTFKSGRQYRGLSDSGLKRLAKELFAYDMPTYESTVLGGNFADLDPRNAATINYACGDSDYTLRLYHLFNDWFRRHIPRHIYIAASVESPAAVYTGIMRYNGVGVSADKLHDAGQYTEAELEMCRRRIHFIIGGIDIGKDANTAALRDHIYTTLQLPVHKTTPSGVPSLDEEAIDALTDYCHGQRPDLVDLFALISRYRSLRKLKSTYLDGYERYINDASGRIHPNWLQMGTATGRYSCDKPNLQNMPQGNECGINLRELIVPDDGNALVSLDFSQIELRVGAYYCRDPHMLSVYETGGDIHAHTTSVVYNIYLSEASDRSNPLYKERRTIAKTCNFGAFYGLYPKGLCTKLKLAGINKTQDACAQIIRNLKSAYPGIVTWQRNSIEIAYVCGYADTIFGRRRYLPGLTSSKFAEKSEAERCALNTPIQGTAADIIKLAMGRILPILARYPGVYPILQVHDELVYEMPRDIVHEVVPLIKQAMEVRPALGFEVPIVAEATVGQSYGQMEECS